ncbi:hypothetical protein FRB90_001800 [Tulasnella sp. 427]|nr:hypothetical protein FRB90_001800 [Tulasnella sp. 427]
MAEPMLLSSGNPFNTVPEDIWEEIFSHMTIREILEVRTVCRAFYKATRLRQVWFRAIQRDIVGENLSICRQREPLRDLPTEELESLARKTMRLAKNMAAHNPRPTSWVSVRDQLQGPSNVQPSGAEIYITQILLLNGIGGSKWLLCMSAGYKISVWEILADPVSCVPAGRLDNPSPILDVQLNNDPEAESNLAITMQDKGRMQSYRAGIMKLSPLETGKIPAFITLETLERPPGSLIYFKGDLIFFFRRRTRNITVINWRTRAEAIFHMPECEEWPASRAFEIHAGKMGFVTMDHIYVFDFPSDEATLFGSSAPRLPIAVHPLKAAGAPMKVEKATIVPYPPAWQLVVPSPDYGMSVILRRKVSATAHEAFHYIISWNDPVQSDSTTPAPQSDVQIKSFRKAVIGGHYCADVKYARSGRGIVLWQAKRGGKLQEGLSAFDPRRRHHLTGEVVWETEMPWRPFAGIDLPGNVVLSACTAFDTDDGEGRIVVGSSDGRITILDFA